MPQQAGLLYPHNCQKFPHEIHIVIHTPRLFRLFCFTEAGHIQREDSVGPAQMPDQLLKQADIGTPAVQQQDAVPFSGLNVIGFYSLY